MTRRNSENYGAQPSVSRVLTLHLVRPLSYFRPTRRLKKKKTKRKNYNLWFHASVIKRLIPCRCFLSSDSFHWQSQTVWCIPLWKNTIQNDTNIDISQSCTRCDHSLIQGIKQSSKQRGNTLEIGASEKIAESASSLCLFNSILGINTPLHLMWE